MSEYLGYFRLGTSYQEKIAVDMMRNLSSANKKILQNGRELFDSANIKIINTLLGYYLSAIKSYGVPDSGDSDQDEDIASYISEKSKIPVDICIIFIDSLRNLGTNGIIDYKYFNPDGSKNIETIKKQSVGKDSVFNDPLEAARKIGLLSAAVVGGILAINVLSFFRRA